MFAKIHEQILNSSIMECAVETRYVWMCLLVMADKDGVVDMTIPSIARRINIEETHVRTAIECFIMPDPTSRTSIDDGNRLAPIRENFGWKIINYEYYSDLKNQEERRQQNREAQQRHRCQQVSATVIKCQQPSSMSAHVDVDVDVDAKIKTPCPSSTDLSAQDIFTYWQSELKHPNSKLDKKRKSAIVARLKEGYSIDRIKQAIRGIQKSPHNMGQNDRNTKFDDIELICRTGANIDRFADTDDASNIQENSVDLARYTFEGE